ncbi:unnamed protein product [Lampetra fluviatilis]
MGAAAASSPHCHEGGALSRVIEVEDTKRPERAREERTDETRARSSAASRLPEPAAASACKRHRSAQRRFKQVARFLRDPLSLCRSGGRPPEREIGGAVRSRFK